MSNGQAAPVLLPLSGKELGTPLVRQALTVSGEYSEGWIQHLIHSHPNLLPIEMIEPAFWPALPVCRELPLRSGYLDNLLVTPNGNLIVVECKLWRNPEARREVIAQAIDYAKDLQRLDYGALEQAIRRARKEPTFELYRHALDGRESSDVSEGQFVDHVSRNLRRARFLLIIAGDGMTENAEAMTEFLQQHAGLHFALAMVQLAIYRMPGSEDVVVVPSVPLRTTTITRGIVQIADGQIDIVSVPPSKITTTAKTLSEEEFFASLDTVEPGMGDRLISFLKSCEEIPIRWELERSLKIISSGGTLECAPFYIGRNGSIDMTKLSWLGRKDIVEKFARKLHGEIPGTIFYETPAIFVVKFPDRYLNLSDLLANADGVRRSLELLGRAMAAADGNSA
jgi:hypothetical protein